MRDTQMSTFKDGVKSLTSRKCSLRKGPEAEVSARAASERERVQLRVERWGPHEGF